jgi:lysozyme
MTPQEFNAALETDLRRDEGVRYNIYPDSKGIPTVGIGHNCKAFPLPKVWKCPLSDNQVDQLFAQDLQVVFTVLDHNLPWWRSMDDVRRRVIANMCFNLGITRLLEFHHAIAAMQAGDYQNAAAEMKNSSWYSEVGERAVRLCDAMQTGAMPLT